MDKARSTRVRASCSASDTALRCDDDRNVLQRLQESYEWVIVNRHTQMQIQTPTDRQTNKQTDRQTDRHAPSDGVGEVQRIKKIVVDNGGAENVAVGEG